MADMKKYLSTEGLSALVDQIKAEDTKVLTSAKTYAEGLGVNYDAAGTAATKVQELADGAVATNAAGVAENKAAIAKLNGDATTDGSVAKAVSDAKALIDADVEAVEAIANKNKEDIAAINNAESGILAQAKAFATAEDTKVQGNIDTLSETVADLDAYVGDIPSDYEETNVIACINKKAQETLDAASGGSSESAASVLQALNTYKAENDPKVAKNTEDIATAQAAADSAMEHSEGVAGDLATETSERKAADEAQIERIAALEGTIVGLSGAMHFEGVKDAVPEDVTGYEQGDVIIVGNKEYVLNGTSFVEFGDASVNAEAITTLTGRVDALSSDMTQAKTDIDNAEADILLKAEKTYVDEKVQALQGEDTAIKGRLDAIEGQLGDDGDVAKDIAAAKQEAIDAAASDAASKDSALETLLKKYADNEDAKIEATIATLTETVNGKAAQSEVTTISGDVATLKTDMAQAKLDIDAVEVKAGANETAIAGLQTAVNGKVAQGDFDNAVARIAQNETDIAALEEASATHALDSDLDAAVERIAANETAIAANTSAINSFTAITADEVNALFA